jgi:cytochrome b
MALKTTMTLQLPLRVWDAPIRLFHWSLVLLFLLAYATSQLDWMNLHLLTGYAILALLLFRLVWGVVGSETARFASFVVSPMAGLRHLQHFREREPDTQVGHNAAGGWMVLILLALLTIQVGSGLFANNDGATEGPLMKFVSKPHSDLLSAVHSLMFDFLLAAVILHVLVVIAYAVVKKHDLVRPMITGKKRLPAATHAPRLASPLLALLVLLLATATVVALVRWT